MISGFQSGAFQTSAFQIATGAGRPAFQRTAFQNNAFQTDRATQETPTGGWFFPERKRKTKEDIDRERIALGIIPAPVEKVVQKAAKRVIARARNQAHASPNPPDPLKWLQEHQAQQTAILERELRERKISTALRQRDIYLALLRIEVEALLLQEAMRLQDEEDAQIVMLLMEL